MEYTVSEFVRFKLRKRLRPWSDPRLNLRWVRCFGGRVERLGRKTLVLDKPRRFKHPLWLDIQSVIFDRVYFGKVYEEMHLKLAAQVLVPEAVVLDIGANIGYHGLWYAEHAPGGRVISVEPHPETFAILRKNRDLWRKDNWEVCPYALGNTGGSLCLSDLPDGAYNSIMTEGEASPDMIKVECITVDELVPRLKIGKRIDLFKLDVEGYEPFVLEGMAQVFKTQPPRFLFVELADAHLKKWAGKSVEREVQTLRAQGYTAWQMVRQSLVPVSDNLQEFSPYDFFMVHDEARPAANRIIKKYQAQSTLSA